MFKTKLWKHGKLTIDMTDRQAQVLNAFKSALRAKSPGYFAERKSIKALRPITHATFHSREKLKNFMTCKLHCGTYTASGGGNSSCLKKICHVLAGKRLGPNSNLGG